MMIFFSRFFSSFRIFPDFHQIFRFLHRMGGLLLTNFMITFFSVFFRFFMILLKFQISMVLTIFLYTINGFLLTYDITIFFSGNLFGFRIFSGFSSNLKIYSVSQFTLLTKQDFKDLSLVRHTSVKILSNYDAVICLLNKCYKSLYISQMKKNLVFLLQDISRISYLKSMLHECRPCA